MAHSASAKPSAPQSAHSLVSATPTKAAKLRRCGIFASLGLSMVLAGCGSLPGPSVPEQPGASLEAARAALRSCATEGPKGARTAVASNYIGSILFGGLVVGPLIVAANQDTIEKHGEATAVDECLAERGYERRDLTAAEVQALNVRDRYAHDMLLEHLIGGGTLETYDGV